MRFFLIFVLAVHGLIHLMGFLKAFEFAEFPQLSQPISKPIGLAWLLVALLAIAVSILSILKKEWWPLLAIIAVVVSQILVLVFWKDAKFGTIANIVLLVICIPAYGKYRFEKMTRKEAVEILSEDKSDNTTIITKASINHLPLPVKDWMVFSGIIGKPNISTVRLRQKGKMKTKPDGKWMSFIAEQYFNTENASFVWITNVCANNFMYMDGRDKLQNGKGEMLIKLFSLFPVVNEKNNHKVDSGSLQRYLAEMCWFPSAALNDSISWEAISANSARAILKINGKEVSGIFNFDEDGKMLSFETQRFYGGQENSKRERWIIETVDFKEFEGIKIPNKCNVTWQLADGDFNWLNLEITDWEYHVNQLW